ncbi:MAG: copper resistance protein NlpE [Bacteroidales bacterium]|nr:copper resistance protein NlpE [Bacteroidales bacterium]MBD5219572.1 copper resistance protein NlpE [Bacteroidales bacterium]
MKKSMMLAAACAAVLTFASCAGKQATDQTATNAPATATAMVDKVVAYTGVTPAADCDGIRYDLKLEYDADDNYTEGDYNLVETYLTDRNAGTGTTFRSEGDFKVVNRDGKNYIKLEPDAKDSDQGATTTATYFLIGDDDSLTLVNYDFELPINPADYTLTVVK